ncbi:MAG: DUF839 domain-containing protein [Candidatus Competibacteraceae bacterium]
MRQSSRTGSRRHLNATTSANGWLSCPDNCAVDHQGRLWVTTDQGSAWSKTGHRRWRLGVGNRR